MARLIYYVVQWKFVNRKCFSIKIVSVLLDNGVIEEISNRYT